MASMQQKVIESQNLFEAKKVIMLAGENEY
jgi:hypothetical protein